MTMDLKEVLTYSHSLRVLFAEDNHDVRIQLIKLFENFFTHIDVEVDGLSAFEKFNNFENSTGKYYDLVITDLSMPRLDGIELCKRIKEKNPEQLILVISAHTEAEKVAKLDEIGIYKFLQKPVDYRVLLNTFTSIVMEIMQKD